MSIKRRNKMKKILAIALMTFSASSFAWYRGPVYVYGNGYHGGWVAPALAGVVVGAAIARPYYPPSVVYAPPVVYTPPPVYVQQPYPAPEAPVGYHWQQVIDPATNLQKMALVPN
jgi:hypothetical protein